MINTLAIIGFILILVSLILMILSYKFAVQKKYKEHQRTIIGAMLTSTLFIINYLIRFFTYGDTKFQGPQVLKNFVYFPILVIHITFAVLSLFLVGKQLYITIGNYHTTNNIPVLDNSIKRKHRNNGKKAIFIWASSFTGGIVTFFLLYILF